MAGATTKSMKPSPKEAAKTLGAYSIGLVPGLAVLNEVFGAPENERAIFAIFLEIIAFVLLAVIHLSNRSIRKWSVRKTRLWMLGLGALALVLALASVGVVRALVATYEFGGSVGRVLVPRPISAWRGHELDVAVACRKVRGVCQPATPMDTTYGIEEVAEALSASGEQLTSRIPSSGSLWFASLCALVGMYAATVASLIALYAIAVVRRIEPARLSAAFFNVKPATGDK